jgi:hypothetical protein
MGRQSYEDALAEARKKKDYRAVVWALAFYATEEATHDPVRARELSSKSFGSAR